MTMLEPTELHRIKTVYDVPKFVKEASLPTEQDLEDAPPVAFADPVTRKYPIFTKAAAYISNALFWEGAIWDDNASKHTAEKLLKSAEYWGIEEEVRDILEKVATAGVARSADDLPDDTFALVVENPEDGSKLRKYPVSTPDLTIKSAEHLYEERHLLPLEWKRQAARVILEKAAEYNVYIDEDPADYIERAAGKGMTSSDTLKQELQKRATLLRSLNKVEEGTKLEKLAEEVGNQPSTKELSLKTANFVDQVDRQTGLYHYYQRGLPLPEEMCSAVLRKDAEAALSDFVQFPSGNLYSKSDIAQHGKEAFTVVPGDPGRWTTLGKFDLDKAVQFTKQANDQDLRLIEMALNSLGVGPTEVPDTLMNFLGVHSR